MEQACFGVDREAFRPERCPAALVRCHHPGFSADGAGQIDGRIHRPDGEIERLAKSGDAVELGSASGWSPGFDLVGAVVYLASEASDMMTGADIVIDGGYLAW